MMNAAMGAIRAEAANAPRTLQPTRATEEVLSRIYGLTNRLLEANSALAEVESRLRGSYPEPDFAAGDGSVPSSIFGQIADALDALERQVSVADVRAARFQSI